MRVECKWIAGVFLILKVPAVLPHEDFKALAKKSLAKNLQFYFFSAKVSRKESNFLKKEEKMRRTVLLALVTVLIAFGCASQDYVKQQIEPLVDRISKLEARVSALETKVAALEGLGAEADAAKKDAADAKALAEEAMKCCKDNMGNGNEAVRKAEAAAERAEAAAAKCQKAFELQQKK